MPLLVLDANLWVAAFDPDDPFHVESVATLRTAADQSLPLAGPALVVLETACALARRTGDPSVGRTASAKLFEHPALQLVALTESLLAAAEELGTGQRLRAADALYAATAAHLNAPLLSWDAELIARGGAISPATWLREQRGAADTVSEG